VKREKSVNSPRDNVIFELGFFMGSLGRERTFMVYCRDEKINLPSDLAGVTPATFAKRVDDNLQAALGPVCTLIKQAIKKSGFALHQAPAMQVELPEMIVKDGVYYSQDGDGPFCTACYDSQDKKIRITTLGADWSVFGRWRCPVCKATYSGQDA
jgi:Predicted nucleotide-binding protein containing TIR-like domain